MFNKKLLLIFCTIFLIGISFVSAVPPFAESECTEQGYIIENPINYYIQKDTDRYFRWQVVDQITGKILNTTDGVTCAFHLLETDGTFLYKNASAGYDGTSWFVLVGGGNFSTTRHLTSGIKCTNGTIGGLKPTEFSVNNYGLELTDAQALTFNYSMIFMMILFVLIIVGLFLTENYIGKLALYWICHLLFIIGTFSIWQFNSGFGVGFIGLIGVWKIMFWVGITSVIPMIILSIVWIFYIHTFNEHFQKLIDKGEDTETAFRLTKKKRGGWFNGM